MESNSKQEKTESKFQLLSIHHLTRKWLVIIATMLIVVITFVVAIIILSHNKTTNNPITDKTPTPIQILSDKISQNVNKGDYNAAQKAIDSSPNIKNSRVGAEMEASIKLNQADNQGTLDVLLNAEKTYGLDSALAGQIANVYEILNQKDMAINYYSKKIELIQKEPTYPLRNADINYLKQHIVSLK